jgi:hypothetical protein
MANPSSRQGLIDYALRALGDPVIEINIDENQIEDRVDEGIQYYREFHEDSTIRTYLKHQITSTDITNGYIDINDNIIHVKRMLAVSGSSAVGDSLFDVNYHIRMNDLNSMHGMPSNVAYYEQLKQYISMIDLKTTGYPQVDFNRHQNRLYIHGDFEDSTLKAGNYLVLEIIQTIDPEVSTDIYNDMFLKEFVTALIKRQWGANLIKFEGMQLPGGVTINSRQIYDDANDDIARLKEEARSIWERPVEFFVG